MVRTDINGDCTLLVPRAAPIEGEFADRLAVVASLFLARTAVSAERRAGEGIPFHTRRWDSITRAKFGGKSIRERALEAGIVEVADSSFRPGVKSIEYRLPAAYRTGECREYVVKSATVKRWVRANHGDHGLDPTAGSLLGLFDQFRIDRSQIDGLADWDELAIRSFERGEYYGVRCLTAGRFYSTVTGMRKKLRSALYSIDGSPLCSLDVSCCQPAIWSSLPFRPSVSSSPSSDSSCLSLPLSIRGTKRKQTGSFLLLCAQVFTSPRRQTRDVAEWAELCSTNRLYDRLAELAGQEGRDEAKQPLCIAMYGKPSKVWYLPMAQVIRRHFSTIWDHSVAMRRENYRDSSSIMQSAERAIMIDGVASDFMRAFPGEPIATIHDELIVPVDREPIVRQMIHDWFGRLEITPHVKPMKLVGQSGN